MRNLAFLNAMTFPSAKSKLASYDHMRTQAETTGKRINADQQARRISSATVAAAFKAQDARYAKASADLTAGHTGLAAKREATNAQIVDDINAKR